MTRRPTPPHAPSDGSGGVWHPSWGHVCIGLALSAGALAMVWMWPSGEQDVAPAASAAAVLASAAPSGKGLSTWAIQASVPVPVERPLAPDPQPVVEGDNDPTPDLSSYVARGAKPSMSEVIERLQAAGIQSGLAAFNAPGTRPNLVGLAVPEDFVLPEGYVRHHQATDDGQRVEAVLMFAPDRPTADGKPAVERLPQDRVVPADQAPPGLPIRQIVIPPPLDSGRAGL